MQIKQSELYKYSQKSKFQDKGREETDKGGENIPENPVEDWTTVEIRTRHVSI